MWIECTAGPARRMLLDGADGGPVTRRRDPVTTWERLAVAGCVTGAGHSRRPPAGTAPASRPPASPRVPPAGRHPRGPSESCPCDGSLAAVCDRHLVCAPRCGHGRAGGCWRDRAPPARHPARGCRAGAVLPSPRQARPWPCAWGACADPSGGGRGTADGAAGGGGGGGGGGSGAVGGQSQALLASPPSRPQHLPLPTARLLTALWVPMRAPLAVGRIPPPSARRRPAARVGWPAALTRWLGVLACTDPPVMSLSSRNQRPCLSGLCSTTAAGAPAASMTGAAAAARILPELAGGDPGPAPRSATAPQLPRARTGGVACAQPNPSWHVQRHHAHHLED